MQNSAPSQLPPTLVIAAPASGSGKTVLTLALLRHFRNQGTAVGSFKVGPDYIDPAFHSAAGGRSCRNIDGWAMRPQTRTAALARAGADCELVIGEGVMGLFDGAPDGTGSTADLAAALELPVILVVDVKGQAASAVAVIEGFARHRDDVRIAGVIFNRVGGGGHRQTLANACEPLGIPLLGFVPRDERLALPERHLGLVQASEHGDLDARLDAAAGVIAERVDTPRLRSLAETPEPGDASISQPLPPLGQRIAVADDAAFTFFYPAVLEGWRDAGAEILPFSPLADEAPAADCDAVYLPGGYPELRAGLLANGENFLPGLRQTAARGAFLFGECGGYMVLGQGLTDADGTAHAMAGLLPLETSFAERRLHLGYRRLTTLAETPFGDAGSVLKGHEFHYTRILREDHAACAALFRATDARGELNGDAGLQAGNVAGSFVHLVDRADQASSKR
jgi:cobyrinic acid a,c-diamide synthase